METITLLKRYDTTTCTVKTDNPTKPTVIGNGIAIQKALKGLLTDFKKGVLLLRNMGYF